jgi:FkbM family methyltransferase
VIAKKLSMYGEYQRHEIELLCSLTRPGDQVLDIGANIGLFALYLSRAVGPGGRVIAFEPDPDNLALLRANLEINVCQNVSVVACALGTESGTAELFQSNENRGNLSFSDLGETGKSITVPVRRGDEVLEELRVHPSLAKIDVEGAEPVVLVGLGQRKPDLILFEFEPGHLRSQGHDPEALLVSLVNEGYALSLIDPDTGERTPAAPARISVLAGERNATFNVLAARGRK